MYPDSDGCCCGINVLMLTVMLSANIGPAIESSNAATNEVLTIVTPSSIQHGNRKNGASVQALVTCSCSNTRIALRRSRQHLIYASGFSKTAAGSILGLGVSGRVRSL